MKFGDEKLTQFYCQVKGEGYLCHLFTLRHWVDAFVLKEASNVCGAGVCHMYVCHMYVCPEAKRVETLGDTSHPSEWTN